MKTLYLVAFLFIVSLNQIAFCQGQKPGDIHPNAQNIDADALQPFSLGLAIIKKGDKTALINHKGEFVAPYGKFQFITSLNTSSQKSPEPFSGIFKTGSNVSIITLSKEIKPPLGVSNVANGNEYLYGHINNNMKEILLLNIKTGIQTKIATGADLSKLSHGLCPFSTRTNSLVGFMDLNGKIIIPQRFIEASQFSEEGLSLIVIKNEFGEQKFGFIDTKGEMVVPAQYSVRPSQFYKGAAFVFPVNNPEFSMALINTKGEIIKKYKKEVISLNYPAGFYTVNGLRVFKDHVMLETGEILTKQNYLESLGIKIRNAQERLTFLDSKNEGKIYYKRDFIENRLPKSLIGCFDIFTKKIFEGTFSNALYFDPVTNLSYAQFILPGKYNVRQGYVNEEGVFVIICKSPSTW